jgi:hypothetical protein
MSGPINFHKGTFSKYPDYSSEEKLFGIYKELKNSFHLSQNGNFISNSSSFKNNLGLLNGLLNNHDLLSMMIENMEIHTSESVACSGAIIFNTMHLMTQYEDQKVASRFLDKIRGEKPDFKQEDMTASHIQKSMVEYKQECETNTNLKKAKPTPARTALLQELESQLKELDVILTTLIIASQSKAIPSPQKGLGEAKQAPKTPHGIKMQESVWDPKKANLKPTNKGKGSSELGSELIEGSEKANMKITERYTDRVNAKRLDEAKAAEKHRKERM